MYRALTEQEIAQLCQQGCHCEDWSRVQVAEGFNPKHVEYTYFSGDIRIGKAEKSITLPGGLTIHTGIRHATLHNCVIGDDVHLYNIHNYIANYRIGDNTCIENVNAVLVDGKSRFGNGVRVAVMNEGGGREIPIFDHLSAHLAYILTLYRHRPELIHRLTQMIDAYAEKQESEMGEIGKNVRILNCGTIKNVRIGDCAQVTGASVLKNGSINSNEYAPVKIGSGVKCNNFIIASGVEVTDSTLISNCFIGQGCVFGKHYSALDSLFFANCQGFHGEATAIFAGPYTVTHHKSTLLIAGMFSFLNAGSGSNQSNHMYKLGPIHQGVAERGSKTTSDSYLLWPAKVGAFTLVMGRHTHHADTSDLPFSYMIENDTESFLVPAANLRTVGTIRDAQKWPKRDNRKDPNIIDQINFNLLSPYTIQKMWRGREILKELVQLSGKDTDVYSYQNCKIRNSSLKKGLVLYETGITKFLGNSIISRLQKAGELHTMADLRAALKPDSEIGKGDWVDCGGMIAPREVITALLNEIEQGGMSLEDIQKRFVDIHSHYYSYEWTWALARLEQVWGMTYDKVTLDRIRLSIARWKDAVVDLDQQVYDDAKKEFDMVSRTGFGIDGDKSQQEQDFAEVRGRFESNPFVNEVLAHIERKTKLCNDVMALLNKIDK